ncbi:MAG: methyl-coenzyme M reductase glutamine C-methyltransferase [Candidatus Helarchaeota archaeon]
MKITIFSPDNIYSYGAMVIAGVLENAGYNVRLTRNYNLEEVGNAKIVGFSFSSTLHLMGPARQLINELKTKQDPFIVVGGPLSIAPELIFRCIPEVDAVVVGEGEETIRELVEAVRFNKELDSIPGIAFRHDGTLVRTEPRPPYKLENSPIPKIPNDIGEQFIRGANAYFESHRGCIANCAFCLIPKFFGQKTIRSKTIPQIKREVRAFVLKGAYRLAIGSGNIALYGMKDHKINEEKVEKMLATISSVISPVNFAAPDIRVDMISDRILNAIRKYTYGRVFFGLESASAHVLKLMRKGITVQKILEAIEQCEKYGLAVIGHFIVGWPGESENHFQETKEFIETYSLDDYSISLPEPIPGTELASKVISLPEDKNPIFVKDTTELGRKYNFTVAERRCFELSLSAATSKKIPAFLSDLLMKELVKDTKQQGEEIRQITRLLKQHLPK